MNDDELNESERGVLDAWGALTPPPGFADRVLAARDVQPVSAKPSRRRWPLVAGVLAVAAAAAAVAVVTRHESHAARGELVAVATRTTKTLGDRAVVVAEPTATLSWNIDDDGEAVLEQRAGDVFYRVDRGGPFVVHTPAGDVRVTGTCFRIEVQDMNRTKQVLLSGAVGAAIATGVVVTVYEGHVLADSRTGNRTEIGAGNHATMQSDGRTVAAANEAPDSWVASADTLTASREQLVARAQQQQSEITKLRARLEQLEGGHPSIPDMGAEPGRAWYDSSPERLQSWVGECHIRTDNPGLDRWQPWSSAGSNERGLEASELPQVNAALAEVQQQWKQLVRALYIEATGDLQGADSLSIEAMRREIEEKGAPDDENNLLQQIAKERAGLAQPPADLSKTTPYERMFRAYLKLGDQSEQAIAKRLGAERAKQIRGDAWGSRSDMSGCPSKE